MSSSGIETGVGASADCSGVVVSVGVSSVGGVVMAGSSLGDSVVSGAATCSFENEIPFRILERKTLLATLDEIDTVPALVEEQSRREEMVTDCLKI